MAKGGVGLCKYWGNWSKKSSYRFKILSRIISFKYIERRAFVQPEVARGLLEYSGDYMPELAYQNTPESLRM